MATMAPIVVVGSAAHLGRIRIDRIAAIAGILVMAIAIIGAAVRSSMPPEAQANPILPKVTWVIGDPPVQNILPLETATGGEQRRRGLRLRPEIQNGSGMAFLLPRPGRVAMDGRDILVPLDVVFVGRNWRVSSIGRVLPGSAEPVRPQADVRLVIEVPAGTAKDSGLVPGALVGRISSIDQKMIDEVPDTRGTGTEPIPQEIRLGS